MPAWPGSLPQYPLRQGYQRGGKKGALIRTPMEVGEAKVRRRTTAAVRSLSLAFRMTHAQLATFRTFVEVTLGGGVARFDFPDPITGTTLVCRFVGGAEEALFTETYALPGMQIVAMQWEIMP